MDQIRRSLLTRLGARFRHWIQTRVWGMDIHETCRIDAAAWIDRTWPRGVHIGKGTVVCAHAVVLTHDFTRGIYLDTVIGDRCAIGPRAIVMPGVKIGDDCIVMPGALVNKDMPPNAMALGNPAIISLRDAAYT